ncbi:MAG: hypothetical protein JWM59_1845 [Verrucomicrobiales bacterium]|nr:hypothetical protein [Verrucomicrobiales bacterium]
MPTRRSLLRLAMAIPAAGLFPSCAAIELNSSSTPGTAGGARGPCTLGIDTLAESGFAALRGRRVGLILNQTSVNRQGIPSRVVLQRALGRNFTSLYTPEHGLDGREKAGIHVSSRRDPLTGLPAYSLYGDTRKPAPWMLGNIDALLFDLQDIGSRSYTYISTMALAMEACAEQGKQFIVLDRPNPLGGLRVQGPPLDPRWKSFVGQIPVPYIHGMTTGELARMINAQGWIKARPQLGVIPMRGWQRWMAWPDTGLRWVPTSPNIPGPLSPFHYAACGILGGLNGVDIGIGTARPFEYAGGKGINPQEFASRLSARGIPGVRFTPYVSTRKPGCAGAQLTIDPRGQTDLIALAVILAGEVCKRTGNAPLQATRGDTRTLFHKVYGSDILFNALIASRPVGPLIASWQPSLQAFRANRQQFLMY